MLLTGDGMKKIQLTWLRSWQAYAVRLERVGVLGLVRCKAPFLPFRLDVEFPLI